MTKTYQLELEFMGIILLGAAFGVVYAFLSGHNQQNQDKVSLPVLQNIQTVTAVPTLTTVPTIQPTSAPVVSARLILSPTQVPVVTASTKTVSQISPDGTQVLTLTIATNNNNTKTYTFVASGSDGSNPVQIYSATYPTTDNMDIPFNTWSPGNQYVFIEHIMPTTTEALVFRADGTDITQGNLSVDANTLFAAQNTGNTYQQATGWSSDTLLIINTADSQGAKSTSYWLSLPDLSIIPLATQF